MNVSGTALGLGLLLLWLFFGGIVEILSLFVFRRLGYSERGAKVGSRALGLIAWLLPLALLVALGSRIIRGRTRRMALLFSTDFSCPTVGIDLDRLKRQITAIIAEAEKEYGPRDLRFSICQLVFQRTGSTARGDSSVSADTPGSNRLIIYLANSCRDNDVDRAYLLAHECVHLLSYVPNDEITWLEEGACEDFALSVIRRHFATQDAPKADARYADAHALVRQLIKICPRAIRAARAKEPSLSRVSAELLLKVCPSCPAQLAQSLVRRFSG